MSDKHLSDNPAARHALRAIFDAAVASAAPDIAVARHLPEKPRGRCVVVGAGKASAAMAAALEQAWPDVPLSGVISTRYDHAVPTQSINVIEAAHPVPDEASTRAAQAMLAAVEGLTKHDLVIALMSGGGSATLALPVTSLSLTDKQHVTRQLLSCGAPIDEMNTLRTHLSAIKGGKLAAAAYPARVLTLLISDVPGDEPSLIASGPTIPCQSTPQDALRIAERYAIELPSAVRRDLESGSANPLPTRAEHQIIASPAMALSAAAAKARDLGLKPIILGDSLEGESRELGRVMAGIARAVSTLGEPTPPPAVLLSGGETTVTIGEQPAGRGGRNMEFALSLALALAGQANTYALAGDSDGIDGTEDAAGALVTPDTLVRAEAKGLSPAQMLKAHNSYPLFATLGDLIKTGPTLTNVNDIRIVAVWA